MGGTAYNMVYAVPLLVPCRFTQIWQWCGCYTLHFTTAKYRIHRNIIRNQENTLNFQYL